MHPKVVCVFVLFAVFAQQVQSVPVSRLAWWPWGGDTSEEQNLNWVLDAILDSVREAMVSENGDTISIPDSTLSVSHTVPFLGLQLSGSAVTTENGVLTNLSSVVRVSDADIIQETESGTLKHIILKAELKLSDLEVQYSMMDASVSFLSYSGELSVSCSDNSFEVAIQISNGQSCEAELQSAKINSLSGCSVKLANGGLLGFFKQYFLSQALKQVIDDVVSNGSDKLPGILTPVIQSHNICQYLNPNSA